jgi:hypothetical protein
MNPLIQTDLLADVRTLPLAALIVVTIVSLGLYVSGWLVYRFWLAVAATFIGGLIGLQLAPTYGLQPVVGGLLAALAAGCVALALGRIGVFLIYGLLCTRLVREYAPRFDVPMACFLSGGLTSVLAYRLAVRLLTCAVASVGLIYGGLVLAEKVVRFDSVKTFAKMPANQLNLIFAGVVAGGVVAQVIVEHYWGRYQKNKKDQQAMRQKQQAAKPATGGSGGGKSKAVLGWFRKAA